ncbi:MAG: tetratricopeptide repeat protein [Pirellulales bacterium]|nr:tetratricopeptide repeat protein [Pirellulales bacterium]
MPRRALWPIAGCLTILAAGCQTFRLPEPPVGSVTAEREARRAEAIAHFEQQRDAAELQAAEDAWDRGDVAACRKGLEALLNRRPSHRDARLLLAAVLLDQHQADLALAHLEAALQDHPNDGEICHAMAVALSQLGRHEEAQAYYRQAAESTGQSGVQTAGYEVAVPANGTDQAGYARLSGGPDSYDAAGNTYPGGADPAAPSPAEPLFRQAEQALVAGSPQHAWDLLQTAAVQNPGDPQIPTTAAVILLRYNRPDLAVALARDALNAFPQSAALLRVLGTAYYRQGEYQSSQLVLQQALSLDKSNGLAYFLMGCTLTKLGQPAQAEEHFRQARRLDKMFAAQRSVSPLR